MFKRRVFVLFFVLAVVFSILVYPVLVGASSVRGEVVKVMRRVEDIRGLKFKHMVLVENMTREEYREYLLKEEGMSEEDWKLAQQEYEALYVLRGNEDAKNMTRSFYSSEVLGFYDHEKDRIVIVGSGRLDEEVLAHELNHALIDQYFPEVFSFPENITDESFAVSALVEGDAVYTQNEYHRRCVAGIYRDCRFSGLGGSEDGFPPAFVLLHVFPYIEGENFVEYFYRMGGWDAVNRLYENPPKSTEQIIHPEKYGVDEPEKVFVEDRCRGGWKILGEDKLGEFAIFVMFWNWGVARFSYKYGRISYSSVWSEGWDGDKIIVYKKLVNGTPRYGYVWRIIWDSVKDVEEFVEAYRDMLKRMGAVKLGNVWKINPNKYVKIFVDGRTATIVCAPSPKEINEIYPWIGLPLKLRVQLENILEKPLTKLKVGEEATWVIYVLNNSTQNQPTTCIIQVKNSKGRVVYLNHVSGVVSKGKTYAFMVRWKPIKADVYTVEVYAWISFENPQPLSKPVKRVVQVTS